MIPRCLYDPAAAFFNFTRPSPKYFMEIRMDGFSFSAYSITNFIRDGDGDLSPEDELGNERFAEEAKTDYSPS